MKGEHFKRQRAETVERGKEVENGGDVAGRNVCGDGRTASGEEPRENICGGGGSVTGTQKVIG